MDTELLTPAEVMKRVKISRSTFERWIIAGKLTPHRAPGSRVRRFDASEVDALFKKPETETNA